MARHRPRHRSQPIWLASWGFTLGLLVVLLLLPSSWWDAIWPDGRLRGRADDARPDHEFELIELAVRRPPPVVEAVAERPHQPPPPALLPEAEWWSQAWNVRIDADLGRRVALPDSLLPVPLVDLWGAQATVELIMATPDSVVNARLWELVSEEQLGRNDLSGLYSTIAKARAYVDMKRREAAMFNEFGSDQIRVPD